jgi:hypothetical protein
MDISLIRNANLVLKTKTEVSEDCFVEGFGEAAPQFVLQMFMILTTGEIGEI